MYVILVTKHGKLAKIDTNEFPHISRGSVGIKALTLYKGSETLGTQDDEVVAAFLDTSSDSMSIREKTLSSGLTFGAPNVTDNQTIT